MKIAIHQNDEVFSHSTNWRHEWIAMCEEVGLEHEVIDLFKPDALNRLDDFDIILWHFTHYSWQEMQFAPSILTSAQLAGKSVFPDQPTAWHFDDKAAQSLLLQATHASAPRSWLFATLGETQKWLDRNSSYPLVAKLRGGSGSHNVRLVRSKEEATAYARQMFGKGFSASPSLAFKATSNIRSAKNFSAALNRMKRAPEFLRTRSKAKQFLRDRGYVYFQEFIPNDDFDLKIVTVGDKASFIVRGTRANDFRASGGGSVSYQRELVTPEIIENAFRTSESLGFQCMGYDYVVDSRTGKGLIVELSYGFSHEAILDAGGYWTRDGVWHDEALNVPREVLSLLIDRQPTAPAERK